MDPRVIYGIKMELDIISKMRHDRTLTLLHHCRDPENIYLVTKFYERKSLYHLLYVDKIPLNKENFCILVEDISNGLIYLHNNLPQILHLDLKPKNILIDGRNEPRAVIADFGLSIMKRESHSHSAFKVGGTYPYMAPELFSGKLTDRTDIYGLAIIMWETLFYTEPYSQIGGIPIQNILPLVKGGMRPTWEDPPYDIPFELRDLIEKCWNGEPQSRPDAIQLLYEIEQIHGRHDLQFVPFQ